MDLTAEIKEAVPIISQLLDDPGSIWEGRHLALIALGEFSKPRERLHRLFGARLNLFFQLDSFRRMQSQGLLRHSRTKIWRFVILLQLLSSKFPRTVSNFVISSVHISIYFFSGPR